MPLQLVPQYLNPPLTPCHITFGTYGTRLHGGVRPAVDKQHNQRHTSFILRDPDRQEFEQSRMRFSTRVLTLEQRIFTEAVLPAICERGGWKFRNCAAESIHVHLLCDVVPDVHGEKVRRLVKRWLGQRLCEQWKVPHGATWLAEEGSNIAV